MQTMKKRESRLRKIERVRAGGAPRVFDLFAGCGGLSLGFQAAGFQICGGIEHDPLAAESYWVNFHGNGQPHKKEDVPVTDITQVTPKLIKQKWNIKGQIGDCIDVIIGGPPCQAFSIVGRAKLREILAHPEAYRVDKRSELYLNFLKYVERFQPIVVLMENVPEIFRFGKRNVPEEAAKILEEMGYNVKYTLLNSVFYGVPQLRDRMFLIAYTEELGISPEFPNPTHHYKLPKGYYNLRNDISKKHGLNGLFPSKYFVKPPDNRDKGEPAITAGEAIRDLPPITLHLEGKLKRGARRFHALSAYPQGITLSKYAEIMRNWRGFENTEGVYDHVIRYLPRDYSIFARMKPNDEYPAAHAVALEIFKERLQEAGIDDSRVSAEYWELKKKTVPPYDPNKFSNKWRKLAENEPARTLTAHIGKPISRASSTGPKKKNGRNWPSPLPFAAFFSVPYSARMPGRGRNKPPTLSTALLRAESNSVA